jgi:hypothetical protein
MRVADPQTVAAWLARADRIKAPSPPAEGPLVANETGWLLARGDLHERLWPGFVQWTAGGSATFAVVASLFRGTIRRLLRSSPLIALVAVGLGVGVGLGLRHLLTSLKLIGWRKRARPLAAGAEVPDGTLVCVVGEIMAQATVATLFLGLPAVLFRNQVGAADETRGIDFQVGVDGDTRVMIDVREAVLLDEPNRIAQAPACGPVSALSGKKDQKRLSSDLFSPPPFLARFQRRHESRVAPGDRVEIIGYLERATEQSPPIVFGTPEMPLLVRRLDSTDAAS